MRQHHIIVRRAHDGEEMTTLDGVRRKLTSDMLLITDPEGPTAIAGVMGGAISEVNDKTTTVLLEAANFQAANIRRTSVALGLRTDASSRFEKGLDPNLTVIAANRAMQLMSELAGGTVQLHQGIERVPRQRAAQGRAADRCGEGSACFPGEGSGAVDGGQEGADIDGC